ncbi:hypothetical protein KSS87_020926 [Heliosperma pusillum]|nr:hypothetical protein KSS87_020926 [Heliosperma pusillum]
MDSRVEALDDRLAELPDTILIHILSFLPTLDSVRTMLLKPFGTLWTSLPSLDFDDSSFDIWYNTSPHHLNASEDIGDDDDDGCSTLNRAFFIFVQNVLARHRRPKITRFRVSISDTFYYCIQQGNLSHELDSWIDFALRKNVQILEFSVGMVEPEEPQYKLPHTEFVSDSITELKLEIIGISLQTRFQLGLLRVLKLMFVEISNSVFREIIRGCPVLKELEIEDCFLWEQLIIDAPNLEKLILNISICYDARVIINCPNLKSFYFTGNVNCLELQDLSSLVDVRFNLSSQNMEFKEFEQFIAVLKPVVSAKFVSFSCEFVTVFFYCMEKHLPQLSLNWKRVKLSMWLTEMHIPGLRQMLRSSPYLEELVIDVTSWHSDLLQPIESKLNNCSINDEDCCSNSLKSVVIYNASMCSYPCLVHLISSLLKNATVLAELVIYYKADGESLYESVLSSEQWTELSNNLLTFPRKRVELSMWLMEKHILGLCRMLRSSPYLEELVIDVTSWHRNFRQPIDSELNNCNMDEEDSCSSSLKIVVIFKVSMCSYSCLVYLICSLLKNATVLAELVIYYKADDKSLYENILSSEQWTEFPNNFLTFPRASQHVIVSLFKEI